MDALKIGVTIALRYSCQRPQFGDKVIMNYLTHQDRLLPILSNAYALHVAMGSLKDILDRKQAKDAKLIHVLSSGLKAAATWLRVEGLQDCRECCGGMGFLSVSHWNVMCMCQLVISQLVIIYPKQEWCPATQLYLPSFLAGKQDWPPGH